MKLVDALGKPCPIPVIETKSLGGARFGWRHYRGFSR